MRQVLAPKNFPKITKSTPQQQLTTDLTSQQLTTDFSSQQLTKGFSSQQLTTRPSYQQSYYSAVSGRTCRMHEEANFIIGTLNSRES